MKLRNVLFGAAAVVMIGMTSCGGSDSPEKVTEDAISSAEKKCPVTESAGLGKVVSLDAQRRYACFYADSVYTAKIHEVKNKYEKQELSESTLKKYKEEYDALEDAKNQAIIEIESRYQAKINDEIDRVFAQTPQIDIPVNFSSRWAETYKDVKCYLTYAEGELVMTFEVIADTDGYSKGFTICGEMNFLNHPSFHLEAVNANGERIPNTPTYYYFNGSDADTFTAVFKASGNDVAAYAGIDRMNVSQN